MKLRERLEQQVKQEDLERARENVRKRYNKTKRSYHYNEENCITTAGEYEGEQLFVPVIHRIVEHGGATEEAFDADETKFSFVKIDKKINDGFYDRNLEEWVVIWEDEEGVHGEQLSPAQKSTLLERIEETKNVDRRQEQIDSFIEVSINALSDIDGVRNINLKERFKGGGIIEFTFRGEKYQLGVSEGAGTITKGTKERDFPPVFDAGISAVQREIEKILKELSTESKQRQEQDTRAVEEVKRLFSRFEDLVNIPNMEVVDKRFDEINNQAEIVIEIEGKTSSISVFWSPDENDEKFSLRIFKGDGINGVVDLRDLLRDWVHFFSLNSAVKFLESFYTQMTESKQRQEQEQMRLTSQGLIDPNFDYKANLTSKQEVIFEDDKHLIILDSSGHEINEIADRLDESRDRISEVFHRIARKKTDMSFGVADPIVILKTGENESKQRQEQNSGDMNKTLTTDFGPVFENEIEGGFLQVVPFIVVENKAIFDGVNVSEGMTDPSDLRGIPENWKVTGKKWVVMAHDQFSGNGWVYNNLENALRTANTVLREGWSFSDVKQGAGGAEQIWAGGNEFIISPSTRPDEVLESKKRQEQKLREFADRRGVITDDSIINRILELWRKKEKVTFSVLSARADQLKSVAKVDLVGVDRPSDVPDQVEFLRIFQERGNLFIGFEKVVDPDLPDRNIKFGIKVKRSEILESKQKGEQQMPADTTNRAELPETDNVTEAIETMFDERFGESSELQEDEDGFDFVLSFPNEVGNTIRVGMEWKKEFKKMEAKILDEEGDQLVAPKLLDFKNPKEFAFEELFGYILENETVINLFPADKNANDRPEFVSDSYDTDTAKKRINETSLLGGEGKTESEIGRSDVPQIVRDIVEDQSRKLLDVPLEYQDHTTEENMVSVVFENDNTGELVLGVDMNSEDFSDFEIVFNQMDPVRTVGSPVQVNALNEEELRQELIDVMEDMQTQLSNTIG